MMVKRPSVERKAISRKGSGDHENVYIHVQFGPCDRLAQPENRRRHSGCDAGAKNEQERELHADRTISARIVTP